MRLVDADEMKKTSQGIVWQEWIDTRPTIDPVHAAGGCYCKECIHHEEYWYVKDGENYFCYLNSNSTPKNGFCSQGVSEE